MAHGVAKPTATRYPGLNRRESRAVDRLRERLRAILPNGEIKSLVLYGSKVRGAAHRHSDIDLLLVYEDVTPEQDAALHALSAELWAERPPLHLFLYRADKLARDLITSPLLYNVARHGIVIQGAAVPKLEIDRFKLARGLMNKAKTDLNTARVILDAGNYSKTISTAYYAVLYAADAALASKGFVAQSHTGTETLITIHFIRKGLIPESFKGLLGRARKARIQADYSWDVEFTKQDAEYWLERVDEFVRFVESSLDKWLAE